MEKLKIYSVSDKYISFLMEHQPNVYSNKEDSRTHSRKYIGVVIEIGDYRYYIPMSSPKNSDYVLVDGIKTVRKSVIPIMRITTADRNGNVRLHGTLRISHMIPVPEEELELYDVDGEKDVKYRNLIQKEMLFIRANAKRIYKNANTLYNQKQKGESDVRYVQSALDYASLEKLCDEWSENTGHIETDIAL